MRLTNKNIKSFLEAEQSDVRSSLLKNCSNDSFDKDVIDGLIHSEIVSSDFENLDKKFYRSKISIYKWMLATSCILILISCFYLITKTQYSHKEMENQEVIINQDKNSETNKKTSNEKQIEKNHTLITEKNYTINGFQNEKNTSVNTNENSSTTSPTQTHAITSMSTLVPKLVSNINSNTTIGIQGAEVFILDYKTLDYRLYRKNKIKTSDPLILANGTPANSAEKGNILSQNEEIEYNYFNYLKETIKLFDKKNYSLALENFNAILNTFSDDVNALFYSGLCYFEQKQFSKSVSSFEQLRKSSFKNFKEEAEWFLLQNLIEIKDFEKAKTLRGEIINGNGFYSTKAKELKIN